MRRGRRRVWVLRFLSTVVVVAAVSYTVQQASECVHRYKLQPVITTRDVRTERSLPIPAFTLCNPAMDGFLAEFYDYNITALHWGKEGNLTMPNFYAEAFPPFDRSFTGCKLLGHPCAQLGQWVHRLTSGFGLCSTFVPHAEVVAKKVGDAYDVQYSHRAY